MTMPGHTLRESFKRYFLIILGATMYAAGFRLFYYPNDIITGGLTGISMIINRVTDWPVGVMIIVMNVPLFALAWKHFGLRFMLGSLIGMGLSSIMMDVFGLLELSVTDNLLLACIYGGLSTGTGLGLIYLAGATTGGVDIVAKFVRRSRPYMNFGTIILAMDVLVIATFALVFDRFESAMYAVIGMFISARTIDTVLYGINTSKLCYIISEQFEVIKSAITEELGRGVTILHGEGAYTGNPKQIILCVIKRQQITDVRRIVRMTDPNAFMVITDAKDVFGDGFADITTD